MLQREGALIVEVTPVWLDFLGETPRSGILWKYSIHGWYIYHYLPTLSWFFMVILPWKPGYLHFAHFLMVNLPWFLWDKDKPLPYLTTKNWWVFSSNVWKRKWWFDFHGVSKYARHGSVLGICNVESLTWQLQHNENLTLTCATVPWPKSLMSWFQAPLDYILGSHSKQELPVMVDEQYMGV